MRGLDPFVLLARSEEGFILLAVIGVLAIGLAFRMLAGALDRDRIRRYILERGGALRGIRWTPFGRGWFGDKHHRIYEVSYEDAQGLSHIAACKTSLWAGVYWTEDRLVSSLPLAKPAPGRFIADPAGLAEENEQLRAEVQRLTHELKRPF
jgi:hypothetical protein